MYSCTFKKSGGFMVCQHGVLKVRIVNESLRPHQYYGACHLLAGGSREPIAECPHFGATTGEVALVKCVTCRGNVRTKISLHRCDLFAECLPNLSGTITAEDGKQYKGCRDCEHNPANHPAAR